MKKKLLPLAIAAAMAPGFASAVDTSGFLDVIYTIADDNSGTPSTTEGKFDANAEVDFVAMPANGVTVRMDVDLTLSGGTQTDSNGDTATLSGNSASLEQAYFAMETSAGATVMAGVFGNPVGRECGDAPCMWGTNGGVIGNILNDQTALGGNNVAGVAVSGAVGPATVTAALLNELAQSNDETSFALSVSASPVEGLDLGFGLLTAADTANSAAATPLEGATNFNASYMIPGVEGLSVTFDILTAGKVVDSATELMIDYSSGAIGAGVRLETVSYEAAGATDTERTTFHVSYALASNLTAILEVADGDNVNPAYGVQADGLTTLELIATF